MRKLVLLAAAVALSAAGLFSSPAAQAAPLASPEAVRAAADDLNTVDNVQYFYGGRRYCWYDGGWRGPGYYWCGYGHRHGHGWGGGHGWHGWSHGGGHRPRAHRAPHMGGGHMRPHGGMRVAPHRSGRPAARGDHGRRH